MQDARSVRAGVILGVVDLAMLVVATIWLVFVCGAGAFPPSSDPDFRLFLFHLAHLALAIPAILLFALSVLFLPIWFLFLSAIVFFIDLAILVARLNLLATSPNILCTLFLFLFDAVFVVLALMYFGFSATAVGRFGLFGGSTDTVRTAGVMPREDFGKAAPVPGVYAAGQATRPSLMF